MSKVTKTKKDFKNFPKNLSPDGLSWKEYVRLLSEDHDEIVETWQRLGDDEARAKEKAQSYIVK